MPSNIVVVAAVGEEATVADEEKVAAGEVAEVVEEAAAAVGEPAAAAAVGEEATVADEEKVAAGEVVEAEAAVEVAVAEGEAAAAAVGEPAAAAEEEQRQGELRHLEKQAFLLANYYFVFQGVVFTAIYAASSDVKCRYHWLPITLSALAGTINFFAILRIAWKYKITSDAADRFAGENISVRNARLRRWGYFLCCVGTFIGFLVVTIVACSVVTCAKDRSSAPAHKT